MIPKPKKYEKENDFVLRCANNAAVAQKFPDKSERIQVCQAAFKKNFNPNQ